MNNEELKQCPECGGTDIEILRLCHNSSCAKYAKEESVYRLWERPAPAPVDRFAGGGNMISDEEIRRIWDDHCNHWDEIGKILINPVVFARALLARCSDGFALVPLTPTPAMLDVAVSFALNVKLSSEYNWTQYMTDVWARMVDAAMAQGEK